MFAKALVAAVCLLATSGAPAQDAASRPGRGHSFHRLGARARLNLLVSRRSETKPTTAVLLFPGYPGMLKLRREGDAIRYGRKGNFLVRARRHLNTERIFTVLVDCPDDQWHDCGDRYRRSDQHASDIEAAIETLRRDFAAERIYLAGTSYGTVSTALLAVRLGGRIDGRALSEFVGEP